MMQLFKRSTKQIINPIEGYNIKHFVIDLAHLDSLTQEEQGHLLFLMDKMNSQAEKPQKVHLVIDSDKEYVGEIVSIMKKHNDWGV